MNIFSRVNFLFLLIFAATSQIIRPESISTHTPKALHEIKIFLKKAQLIIEF